MSECRIIQAYGHVQIYSIPSSYKWRKSMAERLAMRLCPDCWKADQAKKRAEATAKATESAKAAGLPTLRGSEKQVNWAATIRADKLAVAKELVANRGFKEYENAMLVLFHSIKDAKFWINNRDADIIGLMKTVAEDTAKKPSNRG